MYPQTRLRLALWCCLPVLPLVVGQPAGAAPPSPEYKLVVADEFDIPQVNESLWDYRIGRRGGEDETAGWINALCVKEAVTISGGFMRVRHAHEEVNGKMENTCGGLISKSRFGFGYYECRWKPLMIKTPGTHGAFWTRGISRTGKPGEDPTRPVFNTVIEIDSAEISSPEFRGTHNLYVALSSKKDGEFPWIHRNSLPVPPDAEGFVVNSFEYRPDGVIFYENGKEVARTRWNMLTCQQEVWITSLCGAGWRTMDVKLLPGEALFDYFRFYARDWPGVNLIGNPSFDYNTDVHDPQHPVCWVESGDKDASAVISDTSPDRRNFLRHASTKAYKASTAQTLQHILDGPYTASAMVRSSGGQRSARFRAETGATERSVDIPATADWKRIELPNIEVKGNTATLTFSSDGDPGQWLEVDDVTFMKPPTPGQPPVQPRPFRVREEPPYSLLDGELRSFADARQYLFDRWLGQGEAFTVAFRIKPSVLERQAVVDRMPAAAEAGWRIELTKDGGLAFLIGNAKSKTAVTTSAALSPGQASTVVCTFSKGTVTIYFDGKPVTTQADLPTAISDKTAPGRIGNIGNMNGKMRSFDGELGDFRIYNRALSAHEIQAMPPGESTHP